MRILITTSTLPVSDSDEVPAFVKEQAISLKELESELEISIQAPHNAYSRTSDRVTTNDHYKECRFHYFWPFRYERLSGRGIIPALKANKLLYCQIPFLFIFQFLSLLRLARSERPDLIYAHWFTPQAINSALVSRITGIPFIFTTHASDVSVLGRVPFGKHLTRWVCRCARLYTAVSARTARRLERFFSDEEWRDEFSRKLTILPMGVETDPPDTDRATLDAARRRYALDDRPIVLFLGRLAEKKGVVYLLEAVSMLQPELREDLQLVIAGDGQLKHELMEKAAAFGLDNVTFTGYVSGEAKDRLIALADFMCLPSIIDNRGDSEGFPVVLMEGLAAGKLLLASDVSGGETILVDGENGFLFPQKSPSELAATLVRVLNLAAAERERLKARARRLSEQYGWTTIARKHHQLIMTAVGDEV